MRRRNGRMAKLIVLISNRVMSDWATLLERKLVITEIYETSKRMMLLYRLPIAPMYGEWNKKSETMERIQMGTSSLRMRAVLKQYNLKFMTMYLLLERY